MSDVPEIEVSVVSTDNRPTGGGEAGVPLMAPAVGNAIFALTGEALSSTSARPVSVGNSHSYILMVQPAQDGHSQRLTDGLHSARDRRVLIQ